jgi:hypothetical protein
MHSRRLTGAFQGRVPSRCSILSSWCAGGRRQCARRTSSGRVAQTAALVAHGVRQAMREQ